MFLVWTIVIKADGKIPTFVQATCLSEVKLLSATMHSFNCAGLRQFIFLSGCIIVPSHERRLRVVGAPHSPLPLVCMVSIFYVNHPSGCAVEAYHGFYLHFPKDY